MNLKRSFSLYSKGLIATSEQYQEQGPGSQQSTLLVQLQQTVFVSRGKQECNKIRTLTRVMTANYRVLGVTPHRRAP
jgi:hypothetical protein